ncbi:type IV conjugative transfer system protein TraL, partial [Rhizobium brockwellii]
MAADKYAIPSHLDDPELIGLWTLDEFLAMVLPFVWGIMTQHIVIGIIAAFAGWWGLKKA